MTAGSRFAKLGATDSCTTQRSPVLSRWPVDLAKMFLSRLSLAS
jgi:hypothetical protein